jgi:putative ABC transport system permease protein
LIYRLVFENLKHRPVRTLLGVVAIGAQVAMVLALVGVSRGVLGDMAARSKGTGADIIVRPPDSSAISFSVTMSEGIVNLVRKEPHVAQATGTFVQTISNFDSITGIHLDEFNQMSGGLRYKEGGPFKSPGDLVVDQVFARTRKLHTGSKVELGATWHVTGIVEPGKLSRTFAAIEDLQDRFSAHGKISVVYVKLDDPANTDAVIASLRSELPTYKIDSIEEMVSLFSVDNVPMLKPFTQLVIGLAVAGGFLAVSLVLYMTVLERTREIGILKAMGASPGYIMGILLRETVALALIGAGMGILMSFGTRELLRIFAPSFPQMIAPDWFPYAALIALAGSLTGAIFPGLKAAKQDAIEALAYD